MIKYVRGDIFDSTCNILVCPTNCQGIMGAGLAKQFADKWPYIKDHYFLHCKAYDIKPGTCCMYQNPDKPNTEHQIILLNTKDRWENPSKLEWVDLGLQILYDMFDPHEDRIALPKLGCGLGGLDFTDVRPLIEQYLSDYQVEVYL